MCVVWVCMSNNLPSSTFWELPFHSFRISWRISSSKYGNANAYMGRMRCNKARISQEMSRMVKRWAVRRRSWRVTAVAKATPCLSYLLADNTQLDKVFFQRNLVPHGCIFYIVIEMLWKVVPRWYGGNWQWTQSLFGSFVVVANGSCAALGSWSNP